MISARRPRRLHRNDDPYSVLLAPGLIDRMGQALNRLWRGRRVALISERRVLRLHGDRLTKSLEAAGVDWKTMILPGGEASKELRSVSRLYDQLLGHRFGREDAVLAFGGGSVGDTAGFVAATYLRGIRYGQLPTTLLSQIDSSIGAKVGVNHPRGKNLIGAIYRPQAVWIDPDLLTTLCKRDFHSGLFEMLKYGFIGERALFRRMETSPFEKGDAALNDAIAVSVRRKLAVVRSDERESGARRILNFGHTVGHGLEAAGDYRRLRHGEAVGWGMIAAVRLAARSGRLRTETAARMERVVRGIGTLPRLSALSAQRAMTAIANDKKVGATGLRLVLPTDVGCVEVIEGFPPGELAWVLRSLGVGTKARRSR